jgi:hypothetical protein
VKHTALCGLFALACSAHAQSIYYDTFNENDQASLFDCCNTLNVSGKDSPPGRGAVAIPFHYDGGPTQLVEIDVALSDLNGDQSGDRFRLEVMQGGDDLPGVTRHKFLLVSPPAGGQCCRFISQEVHGVHMKYRHRASDVWWVAILPVGPAVFGGWNLNTMGASGPYAIQRGPEVWEHAEGPLPAIRVFVQNK